MRTLFFTLVLAGLFVECEPLLSPVSAQEKKDGKDAAAVRAVARAYLAALSTGDLEAASAVWTPDGQYTDASGKAHNARKLLAEQTPAAEKHTEGRAVKLPETTLRFVTNDVAIEDGKTVNQVMEDGRAVAARFTAVWVKQEGKWRLDSVREVAVVTPSASERLAELGWLIGEWVAATDNGTVLVSSHWSDNGNYIVRQFVERAAEGQVTTGSQRIGWDPSVEELKCWTFDSHGGSAEGIWSKDGDRWIVETVEVMPDGAKAAAHATYTVGSDDRFVWEASRGKIGDQAVPGRRLEFKRAPEK